MHSTPSKTVYTGIAVAVLATFIWSWNFIVARGIYSAIPPVSLAFYRWLTATVIIFPFAISSFRKEWPAVKKSLLYFGLAAASGISIFNTFVYIGARYTTAINLALIGTTSSPVLSVLFARIFLKEHIHTTRILGMVLCITGILFLLAKGDWHNLLHLHFTKGDLWVLGAGLSFAVYNTMVKKKPADISPVNFLFVVFLLGTLLLFPFYLKERSTTAAVNWHPSILLIILYLGLGASVLCFWIWNIAIRRLGAGRAALFGNLIPVFSTLEAVLILGEKISWIHLLSFGLVITGLLIANLRK
ncbi:MAG: DMT family transporter [Sphingobacteriales bacterium]|nr:DMT family transporter [Sphingobacteriales bacterium]